MTQRAPRRTASPTKRWPSSLSPLSATKTDPLLTLLESVTTSPNLFLLPSRTSFPPVGFDAISAARPGTWNWEFCETGFSYSHLDLVQYRQWFLSTRIIGSQHHQIAQPRGNLSHERPFSPVTIATAAEHGQNFTSSKGPHRSQDFLQRIRRVRVVDQERNSEIILHLF